MLCHIFYHSIDMSNVQCFMCPSFQKQTHVRHVWCFGLFYFQKYLANTQELKHTKLLQLQHATCLPPTNRPIQKAREKGASMGKLKSFKNRTLETLKPCCWRKIQCKSTCVGVIVWSNLLKLSRHVNKNKGHRLIAPFASKNLDAVCSCTPPSSANHFQTGLTLKLLLDQRLRHEGNSLQGWNMLKPFGTLSPESTNVKNT